MATAFWMEELVTRVENLVRRIKLPVHAIFTGGRFATIRDRELDSVETAADGC